MRILRKSELKGIIGLLFIALLLGVVLLGLTGAFTTWFGFRLPWEKSISDKIVFVSDRNGHPDIWIINSDGSDQKPLTNDEYIDSEPVVSPDGYSIIFVSTRDEGSQIYSMDVDGSHLHRISKITGNKSNPRFNYNGREISFLCGGGMWRIGTDGSSPGRVLPTQQEAAIERSDGTKSPYVWAERSSDGKLLAGVKMLEDRQEAVFMSGQDSAPKQIIQNTEQGPVPFAGEQVTGAWNNSGTKIVFSRTDMEGQGNLLVIDLENSSIIPFPTDKAMINPVWSSDDSIAAVEAERRNAGDYMPKALLVVDLDLNRMVIDEGAITDAGWSPDGKSIAYSKDGDIYLADVETGKIKNLTEGKGANTSPSWSPAAKQ